MPKQPQTIDTDSLGVATYLHCREHRFIGMRQERRRGKRPPRARFIFALAASVQEDVAAYHTDRAQVNPRLFMDALGEMREHLYAFLDGN